MTSILTSLSAHSTSETRFHKSIEDRLTVIQQTVNTILILVKASPLPSTRILFMFVLEGEINHGDYGDYMKITVTQKFSASIQPVDKFGNPALIDGVPVWEVSNPAILSILPVTNGLSAEIKATGKMGTSQVSVTADADLGTGVKNITGTFQVDVVAGQATGLGVVIGEALEQSVPTTI